MAIIRLPTFLSYITHITHIENNNIYVCVELEDNYTYTAVIETVKNLEFVMHKEKMNYVELVYPLQIFKKLTENIME